MFSPDLERTNCRSPSSAESVWFGQALAGHWEFGTDKAAAFIELGSSAGSQEKTDGQMASD